jgi:hypothetical protein
VCSSDLVTVSVLNGGRRQGLAARTMEDLIGFGFHEGDRGNLPDSVEVATAQIWTDDPASPAVALVSAHLPDAEIIQRSVEHAGVVVVVGDQFGQVHDGLDSVEATTDTTICSPVGLSS